MTDDGLGERLERAAREYHRPPATPREEMWARVQAERTRRRSTPRVIELRPWLRWSLAAAAVLLVGVAIGRFSAPDGHQTAADVVAILPPQAGPDLAYRVAAAQYLTRTEALLTGFRGDVRRTASDTQFVEQARELLLTTRLMLGSPVAKSPRMKALLEDLEVVLAQIATLPSGRRGEDARLINEAIEQRSVLLKLRTSVPAGTQGAL
jgi:hypothetical protein